MPDDLMLPTLTTVLQLPAVVAGRPTVVAGAEHLAQSVRWAHVTEVPDISELLLGGELILTTGVALGRSDRELTEFINALATLPVAGLVVELGRAYAGRLPAAMVRAAQLAGLPLIELAQPVPFIQVTEAVHALVLDSQVQSLRRAQALHETFTELAVEGADTREVIRQAARMAGSPVVLETPGHLVVEHDAAGCDEVALLSRWQVRSRGVRIQGRSGIDPDGWVVAQVGARGQDWGRLVLVRPPGAADAHDLMLAERAATTIALQRLIARDRDSLERQTHRTLLTALIEHHHPDAEIALRARALGVNLDGRRLLGVVAQWRGSRSAPTLATQARLQEITDAVVSGVRDSAAIALVGQLDDRTVGALVALDRTDDDRDLLPRLSEAINRQLRQRLPRSESVDLTLAAGQVVASLRDARRSVVEAQQVAEAAEFLPPATDFRRLHDVGVRGLLALLRNDSRIETFIERELGSLIDRKDDLLGVLRAYLNSGRNKSAAATALHLSRPAFYDRMARLQQALDVDLDNVEACLTLQLALLAHDTR